MLLHTCNLEYNKGGISNHQKKEGMFNNDNGKYTFYKKKLVTYINKFQME